MPDNLEGADGSLLPLTDIKLLINEIMSARAKKILQLIPVDTLVRLVNVLDHQIQCGQGLSINEGEDVSLFFSLLQETLILFQLFLSAVYSLISFARFGIYIVQIYAHVLQKLIMF